MEPNTIDARFCATCKMVLKYDAYNETLEKQERKDLEIKEFQQKYEKDINVIRQDMEQKFQIILSKIDFTKN